MGICATDPAPVMGRRSPQQRCRSPLRPRWPRSAPGGPLATRRWPGLDRGSGHDLHHVADVQGVVESLGRLLRQVYAAVGGNPHAVLVEGITAVEEYRIRHRCVIEQTAAVMEVFPKD